MSFPFYSKKNLKEKLKKDKEVYLGDIIINFGKMDKQKDLAFFKLHLNKLLIHGLVHLFGYDHKEEKDFKKMRKIEQNYLEYIK